MARQDPSSPEQSPSPIEPLDYASSLPGSTPPRLGIVRRLGFRRSARLIYFVLCAIGFFFAIRYMLHYRQTIEDAIHFNDKNFNEKK